MYNSLNIGCGKRKISGVLNIDIAPDTDPDLIKDMSILPWVWQNNTIDNIYMFHFLEHTQNPKEILKECHRILKPKGTLYISVPHSSCANGIGCLTHYRTFSLNSFRDYFRGKMFKTTHQRIVWLPHYEWLPIQWLIDFSPRFFERIWCYWIGGATEMQWFGEKI